MDKNIAALAPQEVWKQFAALCAIPRPSGHETAVRDYLIAQGNSFGIECFADEAGNVIMRKPATPGMEDRKGIILQAHMDMVPQKNNDKTFDFTKDPTFTNFGSNGQNFENGERMNNNVYVDDTMTDYHSVEYREGIYVGYRYYETKGHDAGEAWYDKNVVYPFGYGLS